MVQTRHSSRRDLLQVIGECAGGGVFQPIALAIQGKKVSAGNDVFTADILYLHVIIPPPSEWQWQET